MNEKNTQIKSFIDLIFNSLESQEQVLFWGSAKTSPGFPQSQEHFFNRTLRGSSEKACYFSTATVVAGEKGKLYNRQELFSRMFCVVLDDIGTGLGSKCSVDDLPDVLRDEYSWRLETSPNNYQYGFLLDEPISDLNAAKELIKLIYGAGKWDGGGAMPNKLVRLPCGANLKEKYDVDNGHFKIGLNTDDYLAPAGEQLNTFTPDELLIAVNAGVTWDDIKAGTASKLDLRCTRGTTAWREGVYMSTLDGTVDEVLEWLNTNDMIVNENNEWIDIICPWHEGHTDDMNTAGYKPLGYGANPERRAFHCFHDHCKDKTSRDFLSFVITEGGPTCPVIDPIPALVSKWALDMASNEFVNMQSKHLRRLPHIGFKAGHQEDVFWLGANDKLCKATQYGLIIKNAGLLKLYGKRYSPGGPRIIEDDEEKLINSWYIPNWPIQKLNNTENDWDIFTGFIKYLMPNANDTEWFLDHLASKVQDPVYRGPCVVLTTPVFGSGRGTLGSMLGKLWGAHNIASVGLSALLDGFASEGFNDWLQNVWVIVPEAKESGMTRRQETRAYEDLKTGIDPSPTSHLLKTKYGGQGIETVYCGFIICSQHEDVLNIPPEDRRFNFIECAVEAESTKYFEDLHEWLSGNWEANIWHELSNRDISQHKGFAPQNMLNPEDRDYRVLHSMAGQSVIDRLVTLSTMFANAECEGVLHVKTFCDWVASKSTEFRVLSINGWEDIYKRGLKNATAELKYQGKRKPFKVDGVRYYARHTLNTEGYLMRDHMNKTGDLTKIKSLVKDIEASKFIEFAKVMLNDAGL